MKTQKIINSIGQMVGLRHEQEHPLARIDPLVKALLDKASELRVTPDRLVERWDEAGLEVPKCTEAEACALAPRYPFTVEQILRTFGKPEMKPGGYYGWA